MFLKSTTLVLGAGASAPYGYPLGAGLKTMLTSDSKVRKTLIEMGHAPEEVDEFRERFDASGIYSIDFFLSLQGNEVFSSIGRSAIAVALALIEEKHSPAGDWYGLLFNHLLAGSESAKQMGQATQPLRIITFNYDRSLEYFLHRAFLNTRVGMTNQSAADEVRRHVDILHVYGDIGELPMMVDASRVALSGARNYGDTRPGSVRLTAERVHVISRENETSESFKTAQLWLAEADFVCFLGYGFLTENNERLRLADIYGKQKGTFFACGKGLPDGRIHNLRQLYKVSWHFGLVTEDAHSYLTSTDFFTWPTLPNFSANKAEERLRQRR